LNQHATNSIMKMIDKLSKMFKIPEKYIIGKDNKWKQGWDIFIILLAIFSSTTLPLHFSFNFEKELFEKMWFIVVSNMVDVFFILDFILFFFCSFTNDRGAEVKQSDLIAKNHFLSMSFYFDILAVMGSNFFNNKSLGFFRLFKMLRITRLNKFINLLNLEKTLKLIIQVLKLSFFLLLWIHFQACLWWFVVSKLSMEEDTAWYTPIEFFNYHEPILSSKEGTEFLRYLTNVYYSILIISVNELGP
jgi:hypothetical protein